ncbi:MAG: zinc ribbon domain-containing protein [Nitrososphaeria archaeon]
MANALLICIHNYLHITAFVLNETKKLNEMHMDLGMKTQNTLSNGIKVEYQIQPSEKIKRCYASTQECSNCHRLNKIPLSQRVYVCNYCGLVIDRDSEIEKSSYGIKVMLNARIWLPQFMLENLHSARVNEETSFNRA